MANDKKKVELEKKEEKVEIQKPKRDVEKFIRRKLKILNKMDNEVEKEIIARRLFNNRKGK